MMILFNLLHIRFPIDLCIFCKPLAESHGERRVLSLQGIFQTIRAHKTASTATNAGASHFACFRSVARLTPSRTTFMIGQVTSQMPFTCTVSFEKISERDCSSLKMDAEKPRPTQEQGINRYRWHFEPRKWHILFAGARARCCIRSTTQATSTVIDSTTYLVCAYSMS